MADQQKKLAEENDILADEPLDFETMTEEEVRMAASFTINKVWKALIGDRTERKHARRMLSLEKADKAKIEEIQRSIIRDAPRYKEPLKKLLRKLDENPQFYTVFFDSIKSRGISTVYDLMHDFDILEANFEVFEDLLLLQRAGSSSAKINLVRQLKDQYEFNPQYFHEITKWLIGHNDFFYSYGNFPEYIKKASDILIGIATKHPGDLVHFQTAYDFMNLIRCTSMFGTILDEVDPDFLSDQKSYKTCSDFYRAGKESGNEVYLSLKIRFTNLAFKYPEYKDLLEDEAIFWRFNSRRPFMGSLRHILYILSLYKKGDTQLAEALLDKSDNFNHVKESDFEKAQPWILELDTPESVTRNSGEQYTKALNAYLRLRDRDEEQAQAYLNTFKEVKAFSWPNNQFSSTLYLFDLYGEDLEALKICILWAKEFRAEEPSEQAVAAHFLHVYQRDPGEGLEYLQVFKDIKNTAASDNFFWSLCNYHEHYGEDLKKLKLFAEWHTCSRSNNAVKLIVKNYEAGPEEFEREWPRLRPEIENCEKKIGNKELVGPTLAQAFNGQRPLKELLTRVKFMGSFVEGCSVLFTDKKQASFCRWTLERFDTLIQDRSDFDFLGQVLGKHGKAAEEIMAGYHDCLGVGALSRGDKPLVLEFLDQFRVLSPCIITEYKKAKMEGRHEVLVARLNDIAGRMTGAGQITIEERALPYYDDLLKEVYKNNVGHWTTFESNGTCDDRTHDLKEYRIKPRYEIDFFSQAEISVKEGETLDKTKTDELVRGITNLSAEFAEQSYEPEKMQMAVDKKINEDFERIQDSCHIPPEECRQLRIEEKLALLIFDSMYGQKTVSEKSLKNLLIYYEFAYFEDVRDYIQGTTDRVSRAPNREYALLCELNTFFSDRIKEINKRVIQAGFKSEAIAKVVPFYFEQLSSSEANSERKTKLERMQPHKLGLTDAFIKQIKKTIEGKTGKTYTLDEIRKIIFRYESFTKGLSETSSASNKQRTKAVYGQLRTQREKTRQLSEFITGTEIDLRRLHLGEIDVAELLQAESNISGGVYDAAQFEAYTVQRALNLFLDEKDFLENELAKFISVSELEGKSDGPEGAEIVSIVRKREVLNAYIAKSKETANARMVGGVCVSGDNPGKVGKECMWNMENYFELVLEDPETHRCMGVVLLHAFLEDGKTLTASFNPSSTYLYKVDEKALFKGLLDVVATFAHENGFKRVCTSQNKAIRTNRTGGMFERTMDETIKELAKVYNFPDKKRFSHSPSYEMQSMDTLWEEKAALAV